MAAQKKNGTDEKDDVTSLSEVPAQADRLTVNFSGDALATIDKLVDELSGVDTRKAAVVKLWSCFTALGASKFLSVALMVTRPFCRFGPRIDHGGRIRRSRP
jgi:hypothetical protein